MVTEPNKELAVSSSLIRRQHHDACQVVVVAHRLFLREITNDMRPLLVIFGQYVEEERRHVVVQGLVVKEQFGQQAQILTVQFLLNAVHLVNRY